MPESKILVITDSRGKGLEELLETHTDPTLAINWTVRVYPGATISAIHRRLNRLHSKYEAIIVIAGICNFTSRIKTRSTIHIEYTESKKDETQIQIDALLDTFKEKVHLATITPADLFLQKFPNENTTTDAQKNLENDIKEVNNHIIGRNIHRDLPTVDLADNSMTSSIKKQGSKKKRISKFCNSGLKFTNPKHTDGVHPNPALKEDWVKYIIKLAPHIIRRTSEVGATAQEDPTSSEEDQDPDWNDFKRNRNITGEHSGEGYPGSGSG